MPTIRPHAVPTVTTADPADKVLIDRSGATVRSITFSDLLTANNPLASQAEAQAGTDNAKRMTALRTHQAIDSKLPNTATGRALLNAADAAAARTTLDTYDRATVDAATALARVSRAAGLDLARYDPLVMRLAPSIAVWEPWEMSPDFTVWETQAGARARITEAVVREWVRSEARTGVRAVWLKYVEYFGHWWTKPNFTRWDDRDAAGGVLTPPKYWHEFANNFTEFLADDFDFVGVVIDECARNGLFVVIGLGRVGLGNTLLYVQTGTDGYTGPAALTTTAQMDLAIARTRQLHNDIVTRFAAYRPWILALSSGFEPDHMPTWKTFSTGVTSGAGAHPHVREAGYQWWATPGEMDDVPAAGASLATRATFAQDLIDCGVDMWIAQDAVGPGFDLVAERYTFVSSVPLGQLDAYYARWRRSVDDANAVASNAGRGIGFGSILEQWQMGSEPTTNLTLSATSGASITATSAFGFFTGGMVGQYITGATAGNARISAVASATQATLNTTVAATTEHAPGSAFGSTSLPQGTFSLNSGYANPYPADPTRIAAQVAIHSRYSDEICYYGSGAFAMDSTLTVRLPQTKAGRTDFRTRSKANFDGSAARWVSVLRRERGNRKRLPRRESFFGANITPTGGTHTQDGGRYAPVSNASRLLVTMRINLFRGETVNAFVNDVTVNLQINGSNASSSFTGGKNGVCSGSIEIAHEVTNTGAAFTFGLNVTWQTAAGNPTIQNVVWIVEEVLR